MALTWRDSATVGTGSGDETSHTLSAVPIGAASADRWVVVAVAVSVNSATAISSVTVGGVAAAAVPGNTALDSEEVSFFVANVPTGATADVVVSYNGTSWDVGVSVWTVDGEPTVTDREFDPTQSGDGWDDTYGEIRILSVDIDVTEGGGVIGFARMANLQAYNPDVAGASLDDVTTGGSGHISVSAEGLAAQTGRTVSVRYVAAPVRDGFGVIAFTAAGGGPSPVAGSGSGTLPLSGSGSGVARVTGQGSGALLLTGASSGAVLATGAGASSLLITGSGAGHARVSGQGAGLLPLAGAGEGALLATGQGAGELPLSGSGSGVTGGATTGQGAGEIALIGAGMGTVSVTGGGAGILPLSGTGGGVALARGDGAGHLPLAGFGAGVTIIAMPGRAALPFESQTGGIVFTSANGGTLGRGVNGGTIIEG